LLRWRSVGGLLQPLHEGRHPSGREFVSLAWPTRRRSFLSRNFDGDENAIVDFKYSDPRVTRWFDHHQSAFLTPEDAALPDRSGKKL
jgi:hypothetical protein